MAQSQPKKGSLFGRALEALFSMSGQADRKEFLAALPILFVLAAVCFFVIAGVGMLGKSNGALIAMSYCIFALPATILQSKRLRDMGLQRSLSWLAGALPQVLPLWIGGMLIQHNVSFPWPLAILLWVVLLASVPSRQPAAPERPAKDADDTEEDDEADDNKEDEGEEDAHADDAGMDKK